MKLSGNVVLITGGSGGIGLAFAERFVKLGNQVIVCGRREDALQKAKEQIPELITRICNLDNESDRIALFEWVTSNYPDVNVLVNNAGIQQRFNVLNVDAKSNWCYFSKEITSNLDAPIHLAFLFVPFFAAKDKSAIINVTSGLAFTPLAIAPIYSATKAALHSFSMSLRQQLSDTSIEVIEVAPPAVNTNLGGAGLHTNGEPLDAFADGIFDGLHEGKQEVSYGSAVARLRMSRDDIDKATEALWGATRSLIE